MTTLAEIKKLVPNLPEKDIKFANQYIEKRDFESLRDLVNSAVYKVRRSLSSENPKEEYLNIDTRKLDELQYNVLEYASQFDYEPEELDYLDEEL